MYRAVRLVRAVGVCLLAPFIVPLAHAQETGLFPFRVEGDLVVRTCGVGVADDHRTIQGPLSTWFKWRRLPTPAGANSAQVVLQNGTFHSALPARLALGAPPGLTYRPTSVIVTGTNLLQGPRLVYQSESRFIQYPTMPSFGAPIVGTDTTSPIPTSAPPPGAEVSYGILNANMASLRLTYEFEPTRTHATGPNAGRLQISHRSGTCNTVQSVSGHQIQVSTTNLNGYAPGEWVIMGGRAWQLASVAAGQLTVIQNSNGPPPTGGTEVCLSAGATEHIAEVRIQVRARVALGGDPTDPANQTWLHHQFSAKQSAHDQNDTLDPATTDRFLTSPAHILGQKQRVRFELPITPPSGFVAAIGGNPSAGQVGSHTIALNPNTYQINLARFIFEDGARRDLDPQALTIPHDPCSAAPPSVGPIPVAKYPTTLNGFMRLRPPAVAVTLASSFPFSFNLSPSPVVTQYGPLFRNLDEAEYERVTLGGGTLFVKQPIDPQVYFSPTPAAALAGHTFVWDGPLRGTNRVESRLQSTSAGNSNVSYKAGHAIVHYPGRPKFDYWSSDRPVDPPTCNATELWGCAPMLGPRFAFPSRGATSVDGQLVGNGQFEIQDNVPVDVRVDAPMTFIQGNLRLAQCIGNRAVKSGTAEVHGDPDLYGHDPDDAHHLRLGFARGAFRGGSADYLIAAMRYQYKEDRYRLRLVRPPETAPTKGYDGMLLIRPEDRRTYDFSNATGSSEHPRINVPDRSYDTVRAIVTFPADQDIRNPRVWVGREPGVGTTGLQEAVNATGVYAHYYSVSNELPTSDGFLPTSAYRGIELYALASDAPVTIEGSVETWDPTSSSYKRTPINPIVTTLNGCDNVIPTDCQSTGPIITGFPNPLTTPVTEASCVGQNCTVTWQVTITDANSPFSPQSGLWFTMSGSNDDPIQCTPTSQQVACNCDSESVANGNGGYTATCTVTVTLPVVNQQVSSATHLVALWAEGCGDALGPAIFGRVKKPALARNPIDIIWPPNWCPPDGDHIGPTIELSGPNVLTSPSYFFHGNYTWLNCASPQECSIVINAIIKNDQDFVPAESLRFKYGIGIMDGCDDAWLVPDWTSCAPGMSDFASCDCSPTEFEPPALGETFGRFASVCTVTLNFEFAQGCQHAYLFRGESCDGLTGPVSSLQLRVGGTWGGIAPWPGPGGTRSSDAGDMCEEPSSGYAQCGTEASVFWVALDGPSGERCRVSCAQAFPGDAIYCDPNPLCD